MANMIKVKVNQLKDRLALGGFTMAMANTKGETFEKRPLSPNLCVAFIPPEAGLEILNVFLWLKSSRALILNEIEHFSKVSG